MMKRVLFIALAALLAGVLLAGCSDRSNPQDFGDINTRPGVYEGKRDDGVYTYPRAYQEAISEHAGWAFFNFTENKQFRAKIYTPLGYEQSGRPFPILYLMHDFSGDENYYFSRMLHKIADSLIYEGEIRPFFIVTLDASTPYGGSWYVDNEFFGHFEEMVAHYLIQYVEDEIPQLRVIKKRGSRAIGGFGMGGYGALKLAAKYPQLFSSVSTSNCAGAFDYRGNWIADFAAEFFEEQGQSVPVEDFGYAFDTTGMYSSKPYTLLIFSMAQAFSPHPLNSEEIGFLDSTTFLPLYGIDLPFDYNGQPYDPIWQKWLAGGLEQILTANAGDFDSIQVYMEHSDADQFEFHLQAQALMDLLDDLDIDYSSDSYTGYPGYPADNQKFIYDRLAGILKFHSRYLNPNP